MNVRVRLFKKIEFLWRTDSHRDKLLRVNLRYVETYNWQFRVFLRQLRSLNETIYLFRFFFFFFFLFSIRQEVLCAWTKKKKTKTIKVKLKFTLWKLLLILIFVSNAFVRITRSISRFLKVWNLYFVIKISINVCERMRNEFECNGKKK